MRSLSFIVISFTTLMLLTFGVGGVSMAKCACSGHTSLLMMNDHGCCPDEDGCMTVTTVQLSDSDMPDSCWNVFIPDCVNVSVQVFQYPVTSALSHPSITTFIYSPPRFTLTTVLRV